MYQKIIAIFLAVVFAISLAATVVLAAGTQLNAPLDPSSPVYLYDDGITGSIVYGEQTIQLGPHALYVDGTLTKAQIAAMPSYMQPYVFNDVSGSVDKDDKIAVVPYLNGLKGQGNDGTAANPVNVYIAPYVYWCDDYKDQTIVTSASPNGLFGTVISCNYLKLNGLTNDRNKVILCGNRGQSYGANGNWTVFKITSNGFATQHLTIANYCSIPLDYPLKPSLSMAARTSTITQAQLASLSGDMAYAYDTSFRSRLNLLPFSGTRTLYNQCHFESTADSIAGGSGVVYLNCDFDFYSECPAGGTSGVSFLGCVFRIHGTDSQGFGKSPGAVTAVDCKYYTDPGVTIDPKNIVWSVYADSKLPTLRGYQYNVTLNDQPITISGASPYNQTTDMKDYLELLKAYKFTHNGQTYYNTYNLLRGSDGWDPLGIKAIANEALGNDTRIPTALTLKLASGSSATLTSGDSTTLTASLNITATMGSLTWSVVGPDASAVSFTTTGNNATATINLPADQDIPETFMIQARNELGLCGAYQITVNPTPTDAPSFVVNPTVSNPSNGQVSVSYRISTAKPDKSYVTWFRCTDASGANPIAVAVTRYPDIVNDLPVDSYTLTEGDVGYYLMASVAPKDIRSLVGTALTAVTRKAVISADVKRQYVETDFKNFVTDGSLITKVPTAGFWTVNQYIPVDTTDFTTYPWRKATQMIAVNNNAPFTYGTGQDGAAGYGLMPAIQGGEVLYTPATGTIGDMKVTLQADPEKTGGQGFGSATNQYLDLFINYDPITRNGYSVRVERTPIQSDGVNISLMEFKNGYSYYLPIEQDSNVTDADQAKWGNSNGVNPDAKQTIKTIGYLANCTIAVWTKGNKIYASLNTNNTTALTQNQLAEGLIQNVTLSATMDAYLQAGNSAGFVNTGTISAGNRTMIHNLKIEWNPKGPAFDLINNQIIQVGKTLQFSVTATDPENDSLDYSTGNLPEGANFDPATKTFSWTPDVSQVGSHIVRFEVSDGLSTTGKDVVITVEAAVADSAVLVGENIPDTMVAGKTYTAQLTVKNTGTSTWTPAGGYELVAVNNSDPFAANRQALSGNESVAPGQVKSFTIAMAAPSMPGQYTTDWQMVHGTQAIGTAALVAKTVTVTKGDDVIYVSDDIPTAMIAGQSYTVHITVANIGDTTWTAANRYKLGAVGETDPFAASRIHLDAADAIAPGASTTFAFTMKAPATAGTYTTDWRMIQERVSWFGPLLVRKEVTVSPAPIAPGATATAGVNIINSTAELAEDEAAAVIENTTIPATMTAGQSYTVSVTVKNTSNQTWTAAQGYKLVPLADGSLFTPAQGLDPNDQIAPGQEKTFTFTMKAPATVGTYNLDWQMVQVETAWLGAKLSMDIVVQ